MFHDNRHVFRILRFFSVASLLCILLAAILLALFYRHAAVEGIVDFGERSNLLLTQSLLNALEPGLSEYLVNEERHHTAPLPMSLQRMIRDLMKDTRVVNVTILDDEGIVVFSTNMGVRGEDRSDSLGYKKAYAGDVHRGGDDFEGFSLFSRRWPGLKLISSFIPVRTDYAPGVSGVFAVETDVTPLLRDIELRGLQVFFVSMGIMGLLYLALLYIVRYAERLIQRHETALRERSRALEVLSSQLITEQENEKKRLAHELHEGVAQTLSSIKFRVEHAVNLVKRREETGERELESLVPVVQDLIKEVRALALEMRPPSLDELGALATLQWYCHEFTAVYPLLDIRQTFLLEEPEIPMPIKVVLYRAVQQRLQYLARKNVPLTVAITVRKANRAIALDVTDDCAMPREESTQAQADQLELVTLREFLVLSGAEVKIREANGGGKTSINAEWPI